MSFDPRIDNGSRRAVVRQFLHQMFDQVLDNAAF
jgi:hypothetical protein